MYHDQLDGIGVVSHSDIDSAVAPSAREDGGGLWGWDDLRVDGTQVRLPASSAPTWAQFNSALYLYAFSSDGGEYAHFSAQLPHGYVTHAADQSPAMAPYWHVHFTDHAGAISGSETVVFRLTYSVGPVNGKMSAEKTVDSTFTASGPTAQRSSLMTADVMLDPTLDYRASTILLCRIERLDTGTYAGDVGLLSTDFHIRVNRIGSSLISGVR